MNAAIRERLEAQIKKIDALPAMPVILGPLRESLEVPVDHIDVDRVVQLISYDKSIAAQCIRMTNSPLFGRRQTVESVRDAVLALGFWRIRDIVFSCAIPNLFPVVMQDLDAAVFWRHSLGCAMVSAKLARLLKSRASEKAYLAGLLHDLGLLVNATIFSAEYPAVLEKARIEQVPVDQAERELLGLTHSESGRILAEAWNLSEDVAMAVEFHHNPALAPDAKDLVALVHLCDLLCRLRGMGYGYYEALRVDFASSPAWKLLAQSHPHLDQFDLTRFTLELDEYSDEVRELVANILGR